MSELFYKVRTDGISITLYVQPNAKKSGFSGTHGDALKLKISAPPVDGEANEAVIAFLSKHFCVPKKSITLLSGETSRKKIMLLSGVTEERFKESIRGHL